MLKRTMTCTHLQNKKPRDESTQTLRERNDFTFYMKWNWFQYLHNTTVKCPGLICRTYSKVGLCVNWTSLWSKWGLLWCVSLFKHTCNNGKQDFFFFLHQTKRKNKAFLLQIKWNLRQHSPLSSPELLWRRALICPPCPACGLSWGRPRRPGRPRWPRWSWSAAPAAPRCAAAARSEPLRSEWRLRREEEKHNISLSECRCRLFFIENAGGNPHRKTAVHRSPTGTALFRLLVLVIHMEVYGWGLGPHKN